METQIFHRISELSRRISELEYVIGTGEQPVDYTCVTINDIKRAVCRKYGNNKMYGRSRSRESVEPRQVAMYLARKLTYLSLPGIARHFGGIHHSTVLHASRKIADDMSVNPQFRELVESLERELTANPTI